MNWLCPTLLCASLLEDLKPENLLLVLGKLGQGQRLDLDLLLVTLLLLMILLALPLLLLLLGKLTHWLDQQRNQRRNLLEWLRLVAL